MHVSRQDSTEIHVLLATDSDLDWPAISQGIRAELPDASVLRVRDGDQALRHVFEVGLFTAAPTIPDLIILDEALPRVPATEVLRCVRRDWRTQNTSVLYLARGDEIFSPLGPDERTHVLSNFGSLDCVTSISQAICKLRWTCPDRWPVGRGPSCGLAVRNRDH